MSPKEGSQWQTETGLPNDVDAWISKPRFGFKEEYQTAVQVTDKEAKGLMFLVDLVDEKGELIGQQGWSVGSGWVESEDGEVITHPNRANVVGSSLYGQLQKRVTDELAVDMDERGKPTEAKSWAGLGFHWMLEEHATVAGPMKQGLMPVTFLDAKGVAASTKAAPAKAAPATDLEKRLGTLAQENSLKDFQKAALKIEGVAADDDLMAAILDDGADGFFAKHQK